MERPIGVTVLACLYLIMALAVLVALIPSQTFDPFQSTRFLTMSLGNLVIGIILGIALLRMKSWSRWLAIIASVVQLLFVAHEIAVAQSSISIVRSGLRTAIFVWAIWYLTRSHVKTAFKNA
jgi:uncharacterized membrane protein (DUF2068 family)